MDIAKFIDGLTLWFSKEIAPFVARISALEARQPEKGEKGDPGKDFDPSALAGMFVSAEKNLTQKVDDFLKSIPLPENGKDGVDGKDADITPVIDLLETKIDELKKSIPIPKDGVDGKDGKDADPEHMKALVFAIVAEEVAEKVSKIPVPKDGIDGKNVEIEQVKALVDEVFAQIPPPKDGKDGVSVDFEHVKQLVSEEVAKIPAPQNGKDADPDVIKAMVQEAVSAIPVPENGKDADPELIKELVSQAVAEIPVPTNGKDGKSVEADEVYKMIQSVIDAQLLVQDSPIFKLCEQIITKQMAEVVALIPPPMHGMDGKDGIDGKDGEKGLDGKNGEDGRDALDIQILPAIDETKTYPRGTYAQHKNGLWRTYQKSHGMKGWECIWVGLADIEFEQKDERNFSVKTILSNGEIREKSFAMKNTIYRKVYQDDKVYEEGDFVTWGGNIWHCNIQTSLKPREGIEEWTLAVKRGRDYIEPAKLEKRDPKAPVKMS